MSSWRLLSVSAIALLAAGCGGGSRPAPVAVQQAQCRPAVSAVEPADAALLGDLDGDGQPTVGDAIKILRIVVGLDAGNPCADANQNCSSDVGDAIKILRCVVGLDTWPLGECAPSAEILGPTLGDLTPTSVRVAWFTDPAGTGHVQIGGQQVSDGQLSLAHEVRLEGLEPARTYEYCVRANVEGRELRAGPYRFQTPPSDLNQWTFCAYGDTRTQHNRHRDVVLAMNTCRARLALHTGDLVNDGRQRSDWEAFFPILRLFAPSIPFYPCLGNHERNDWQYYHLLPLPEGHGDFEGEWYSFVFGNCQFIALDSNQRLSEQRDWLQQLLASPRPAGVDWRIAFFHHPPFSSGPHGGNEDVQNQWCPQLEAGDVSLVFCGHDHIYERSLHGGLTYITAGNGGAPLYEVGVSENPYSQAAASVYGFCRIRVTSAELVVTSLTDELQVIDEFTITR